MPLVFWLRVPVRCMPFLILFLQCSLALICTHTLSSVPQLGAPSCFAQRKPLDFGWITALLSHLECNPPTPERIRVVVQECYCNASSVDGMRILHPKPWSTIEAFWETGTFAPEEAVHWRTFYGMADVRCLGTHIKSCPRALKQVQERSLLYIHLLCLKILADWLPRLPNFFLVTHRQDAIIWPKEPVFGAVWPVSVLLVHCRAPPPPPRAKQTRTGTLTKKPFG